MMYWEETEMPYSDIVELHESVRNNLPAHAQEIYMKALGLEQMCHIYSFGDV